MPLPDRTQLRPYETPGPSLDKEIRFGEKQQRIFNPIMETKIKQEAVLLVPYLII